MLEKLKLERPIAFFDLEATGVSPRSDRIVEVAISRLGPDGKLDHYIQRVNPEIPIPPETTEIHGISDEDVKDCPTFPQIAKDVYAFLEGCDLGGYNVLRYDIPMLTEEFTRAGFRFDWESKQVIDAQRIFHQREPRDLAAALTFYCDDVHLDAHGAEADVLATMRVLEGELERYGDLPHTVAALDDYCNPRDPAWVDRIGRLKWQDGEIVLNFSRKKGALLRDLIENDRSFVKWILRSDFPADMREIVARAVEGEWPAAPGQ